MAATPGLEQLLGAEVLSKNGKIPTADLAKKSAIGLYFSAHWCGPCRMFTPQLTKIYNDLKDSKGLEIVFVSADKDDAAFQEYFGSMPWLALPFDDAKRKAALNKKFKVQGIPTLVFVDGEGNLINKDGRAAVSSDPKGEKFPWKPPTLKEVFAGIDGGVLQNGKNGKSPVSDLAGKTVGIYFSAHWCPPCKMFTPKLIAMYKKLQEQGKKFEVVFVSSDRDQGSFDGYYGDMPWKAVPFAERGTKQELGSMFNVEGIPTFVVLDWDSGKIITQDGVQAVMSDESGENFPWRPKPVNPISEAAPKLNEGGGIIAFVDDEKEAMAALEPLAKELGDDAEVVFLWSKKGDDDRLTTQVRSLMGVAGKKDVALGMLDLPSGEVYISDAKTADDATVRKFWADIQSGTLKPTKPNM